MKDTPSPDVHSGAKKHIAIFLPSLTAGGVGRVMLNIAKDFARRGHTVDLVLCQRKGPYLNTVPPNVNIVELNRSGFMTSRLRVLRTHPEAFMALCLPILLARKPPKAIRYLDSLAAYLQKEQPDSLLSAKTPVNLVALWAKRLANASTRIVLSEQTNLSMSIQESQQWRWRFVAPLIKKVYPQAEHIFAVSRGVADDLAASTGLPRETIGVIFNPTVTTEVQEKSQTLLSHSWLPSMSIPVILGVGRLVPQKRFTTLLKAFAIVRKKGPVRLIILGEGRERSILESLASQLGVEHDVSFPGFEPNPYAYMSRVSVFALSSAWEGLPTVLIEALACGCPVVSTNCPSGPQEILDNGVFGPLVPVGDEQALANAILHTLEHPPDVERLRLRAEDFDIQAIAERYLRALLPI